MNKRECEVDLILMERLEKEKEEDTTKPIL